MAVRALSAVAVLAAAAVVCVLVRRDRRLRRSAVSERLMAGCAHRDNVALSAQVDAFEQRLSPLVASDDQIDRFEQVPVEGGPR
ncbi:hypothetical protein ACIQVL_48530 [Streptomyces sp. NPDC090499]|uniref:hypothetical protein n=1 Tax=Streptomyces sp. NPDC090499 TaxID=3365965 RepID=UPI003812ADB2